MTHYFLCSGCHTRCWIFSIVVDDGDVVVVVVVVVGIGVVDAADAVVVVAAMELLYQTASAESRNVVAAFAGQNVAFADETQACN